MLFGALLALVFLSPALMQGMRTTGSQLGFGDPGLALEIGVEPGVLGVTGLALEQAHR